MKKIIINADDFGYSKIFNKKILELLKSTALASTSVMIKRIDKTQNDQVKKLKRLFKTRNISVGLHVEFENEDFEKQISEQFKLFNLIFGFDPTHIDIHKATFLKNGYPAIMRFAAEKKIPCKNHNVPGPKAIMTSDPIFDATGKNIDEIEQWLKSLKEGKTYLIQFHPGIYDPNSQSSFNQVREKDAGNIEMLTPILERLRIKPISFKELGVKV